MAFGADELPTHSDPLTMPAFLPSRQSHAAALCWVVALGWNAGASAVENSSPTVVEIPVAIDLQPADATLEAQLLEWAGQPAGARSRDRRFWLRELPERLQLALQSEGWYDAEVQVDDAQSGIDVRVRNPVAVRLQEVAVSIPGAASQAPELLAWLEQMSPPLGQRVDHATYEALREGLLNRAIVSGFLEAQFTRQRLLVSVRARSASIDLSLALGPAYRVGEITLDPSPIRDDIVLNLAPFRSGDRYTAEALAEYARRLRDSRFFASARVLPEFDRIADGAVPLRVRLEARKPNRIRLGAGYASDVGLRLRAGWDRYLIDERGHSVALDTELSSQRRSANVEYRMPDSDRPATRSWLFSAGSLRETVDGTASTQQTARVARERRRLNGVIDTTYIRYQRDRGLPDDSSVEFQAFMGGVDLRHTGALALGAEREVVFNSSLQWLGAHKDLGADFSFTRAYGRVSARVEMQPRHWLRSRVELGQLWRADIATMPISLRFFAGGDGSIRGFGPRDASPQDADGNATGGTQLMVGSLEYEYRWREAWGAAVFADRGRAWVDGGEPQRTGAGVGLRWYSPVGPVSFDVARPIAAGDGDWRIHLTIGL